MFPIPWSLRVYRADALVPPCNVSARVRVAIKAKHNVADNLAVAATPPTFTVATRPPAFAVASRPPAFAVTIGYQDTVLQSN